MKYLISILIIILSFFINTEKPQAGELTYTCTVMNVYEVDKQSELKHSIWQEDFKGSEFTISRVDGTIIGEVLPTAYSLRTYVHNFGSTENSFKASADFGNQYQLIEIQEFKKGEEKPFVAMSMGGAGIVTGFCK